VGKSLLQAFNLATVTERKRALGSPDEKIGEWGKGIVEC